MNYFVKGNFVVDATWILARESLKSRYQRRYRRNPGNKELENFRWFLSDPKPSDEQMKIFYKKHEKAKD